MESDLKILAAFSEGNPAAFAEIYKRFYPVTLLIALRYIPEDDAKDVRSGCFIKLWQARDKLHFESMGALFSWLKVTISNACIDHIRSTGARQIRQSKYSHLELLRMEREEIFDATDKEAAILRRLLDQIETLPSKYRTVFKLRWLENLKYREIATLLRADISTVKKRYARAVELLRKQNIHITNNSLL